MPSWPRRALSPKREKPRMELSRAMKVGRSIGIEDRPWW